MRVAWCDGCNKVKVGIVECGEKWERGQFCEECLRHMRWDYCHFTDDWRMIRELDALIKEIDGQVG